MYAVYAIGVLVALLVSGGLSDLIGRRPVIATALLGLLAAQFVFMLAAGLEWLYAARSLQGLSTGLLLGATGAALIDLHPRRDGGQAGLVNGVASASGSGWGRCSRASSWNTRSTAGDAVRRARGADRPSSRAAWRIPETVAATDTRLRLTPQMPRVPRALWRTFALSSLGVLAAWSVGGLYLSLGPIIVGSLLDSHNHAVGGIFVFAVCACGALAQWALRARGNRVTLVGGAALLAGGSALTAVSISAGSLDGFLIGSIVVGLGFGAAFMGALRTLAVKLPPAHRAGVMSAFFVVAYASISIPAIGAGVAAVHVGVESAATWFGMAVAVVAALVAIIGWYELREDAEPIASASWSAANEPGS